MKFSLPFGPGALVAAAFIGPGTVTACTLAGANFGYALLWALVFATIATIVLQDMAARLGAGAGIGLGQALLQSFDRGIARWAIPLLVFVALAIGNAAYEAGNLAGAALGLQALGLSTPAPHWLIGGLALIAATVLWFGNYIFLERFLVGLVLLMSLAFIISAVLVDIDWRAAVAGLQPRIPDGGLLTAIALIGTTIVPYNLFLHAAACRQRWQGSSAVHKARTDTVISIGLGGLVSMTIVATAATALYQSGLQVDNAADMARSIEPAFGAAASYLVGLGLLAAGLTSAITAPMATAWVVCELLGVTADQQSRTFRLTALLIIAIGAGFGMSGIKPISLILVAQFANGLMLPIIAVFLLLVMNRKSLLGAYSNGLISNIAGSLVVLVTVGLGLRAMLRAAGIL